MNKAALGIIISHRSTDEGHYPESSLNAFRDGIHQLNKKTAGQIQIAFDYEGYEDSEKNNTDQENILKTIEELNTRKKYSHLLFFRLIDPEYGSGMRLEYSLVQKLNLKQPEDNEIGVRTLVRKYKEGELNYELAENNWNEITDKNDLKKKFSRRYETDKELKLLAKEWIYDYYVSKTGKHLFPWKIVAGIILAILSAIFGWYILSRDTSKTEPEPPIVEATTPVDSTRTVMIARIDSAETLINSNKKRQARSLLLRIREECDSEWTDLSARIESLLRLVADPIPPRLPAYLSNGCMVVVDNNDPVIQSAIESGLKQASLGLSFLTSGKPEWMISVSEKTTDTTKVYGERKVFVASSTLSASIQHNGNKIPIPPVVGNANSQDSAEKAIDYARTDAIALLIEEIIEEIKK